MRRATITLSFDVPNSIDDGALVRHIEGTVWTIDGYSAAEPDHPTEVSWEVLFQGGRYIAGGNRG